MSAPSSSRPPVSTETASSRHLRVLYADDLPELRDVVRITLSRDGHGIECVAHGQHGLNRVAADPGFDLVITDHHMPVLNGLEFVRGLRALGYPGRIMVFSSELGDEVAAEYRRLAVDRILYKPVFPAALRGVLSELFPGRAPVPAPR